MNSTMKGATAPPIEEPLSKNAVASERSRLGNHSDTALEAAGQLADSPAPKQKRQRAKPTNTFASEVAADTREYQATLSVNPRLVPIRSISQPKRVCPAEYATR